MQEEQRKQPTGLVLLSSKLFFKSRTQFLLWNIFVSAKYSYLLIFIYLMDSWFTPLQVVQRMILSLYVILFMKSIIFCPSLYFHEHA